MRGKRLGIVAADVAALDAAADDAGAALRRWQERSARTLDLRSGRRFRGAAASVVDLREYLRTSRPDVVVAHGVKAALLTLTARAWRVQGEDTRRLGGRWRSWGRRPLFRVRRSAVRRATT